MSAQTNRAATGGMMVVDCDVHVNDLLQYLAPYCEMPWRKSLEILGPGNAIWISLATHNVGQSLPLPGGGPSRSIYIPQAMRNELDELGIDYGILLPDHLLLRAAAQH